MPTSTMLPLDENVRNALLRANAAVPTGAVSHLGAVVCSAQDEYVISLTERIRVEGARLQQELEISFVGLV